VPSVDDILGGAREAMSVRRVFGEPIERDGVTIVPVARIRGGGGGGGDKEGNGGAGFGLVATPAGVYVLEGDSVTWKPASNPSRVVLGAQLLAALAVLAAWSVLRARSR